jgi:hypothetical protein
VPLHLASGCYGCKSRELEVTGREHGHKDGEKKSKTGGKNDSLCLLYSFTEKKVTVVE